MKVIKGTFSDKNKKQKNSTENEYENLSLAAGEDGNYSLMLLDLIKPYLNAKPTVDEVEEKVGMGILAWNISIPKSVGLNINNDDEFRLAITEAGYDKKQEEQIKKMEKDKLKKYREYTDFIKDYELVEDDSKQLKVFVRCISLLDMMLEKTDFDEDDDFGDDDDFDDEDFLEAEQYEEGLVNRNAVIISPKSAYVEWIKKVSNLQTPPRDIIYLTGEKDTEEESDKWLKENFQKIMVSELMGITKDKNKWPKLNYKDFCNFFEIKYLPLIWDLERTPLEKF